jgi:cyanate permease
LHCLTDLDLACSDYTVSSCTHMHNVHTFYSNGTESLIYQILITWLTVIWILTSSTSISGLLLHPPLAELLPLPLELALPLPLPRLIDDCTKMHFLMTYLTYLICVHD